MTEEAKKRVEALRMCPVPGFGCCDCPVYIPGQTCQNELKAADLIESLFAQLDQVSQERDGLSIMLTSATSAAETYKRERDAAVDDISRECHKCKHFKVLFNGCTPDYDCDRSDVCRDNDNWQWRGVEKEVEG